MRFVTSSIEKRASLDQQDENSNDSNEEEKLINPAAAYRIAASAASRLFSHSKSVLPFGRRENEASLMATADSVTAVVAAKEEAKQAVADDLKSNHSPPCEWFVCDDDKSGTRFFFIQVIYSFVVISLLMVLIFKKGNTHLLDRDQIRWPHGKLTFSSSQSHSRTLMCLSTEAYTKLLKESTSRCYLKFMPTSTPAARTALFSGLADTL